MIRWLAEWKGLSEEQRAAAVVFAWRTELLRAPRDHENLFFTDQVNRFRNLLRRGPAMLPAVEAAQLQSSDLTLRGGLGPGHIFRAYKLAADYPGPAG